MTAAAVDENDRDVQSEMYADTQAQFRDTSPFAIMFQQIEQTGLRENVQNLVLDGATTAVSYWPATK